MKKSGEKRTPKDGPRAVRDFGCIIQDVARRGKRFWALHRGGGAIEDRKERRGAAKKKSKKSEKNRGDLMEVGVFVC